MKTRLVGLTIVATLAISACSSDVEVAQETSSQRSETTTAANTTTTTVSSNTAESTVSTTSAGSPVESSESGDVSYGNEQFEADYRALGLPEESLMTVSMWASTACSIDKQMDVSDDEWVEYLQTDMADQGFTPTEGQARKLHESIELNICPTVEE